MKPDQVPQRPEDQELKSYRRKRDEAISKLSDFRDNYTVGIFLVDLEVYFEGEVDFNLEKIQETIETPGKLDQLVKAAKEKNTHPITEFIQEIFKDSTS